MNHYANDYRVRAIEGNDLDVDEARMVAHVEFDDDTTGDTLCVDVPIKFDVCSVCQGKGTHVNPSIDAGGLSREDFDDDPDFERDYFGGTYDVQCYGCNGKRVEAVLDRDGVLTDEQRKAIAYLDDGADADAEYDAECEAERRAGC